MQPAPVVKGLTFPVCPVSTGAAHTHTHILTQAHGTGTRGSDVNQWENRLVE